MGRHYWGDIEGKFWFGVQSSDDASFFGGTLHEPQELNFHFDQDDLETIEEALARCRRAVGDHRAALDAYFKDNNGHTDAALAAQLGLSEDTLTDLLAWYARLQLGEKIHAQVKETGACNFTAEL